MYGGYADQHGAEGIVFDMDPASNDIVVGGWVNIYGLQNGLVYYVDDSACNIRWVFRLPEMTLGVHDVNFTSDMTKVVGVGQDEATELYLFTISLSSLDFTVLKAGGAGY